jgi:DNA-binding IclR family transcriptional regulator
VYDQSSNTYRLGAKLWKIGRGYIDQSTLYEAAARHMRHLAAACRESVFLGVLHEDRVTYIRQMENPKSVMAVQKLGKHAPAYCTATGRAIIAFLADERIEELLSGELRSFNSKTVTGPEQLKEELAQVREERVAIVDGEYNAELLCISSPVFDETFQPAASLTVALLTGQAVDRRVTQIAEHVKETADNLSSELGYLEEDRHAL